MKQALPFQLSKDRSFFESLGDWMGDVLYDELPEKGFECRDEQIFMAYQIEKTLKEKNVLFAEAGVGTGKTIAYLLPAISYARYTGKPALIACADETLIEQLVKEAGDIFKLQNYLDIKIDVRLAKSRDQYLCLKRLEEAQKDDDNEYFLEEIEDQVPDFVYAHSSMQKIFPYGERSQFAGVSDEDWQKVNYHPTQQCMVCDLRNRCGQTIHRQHYRESTDLIICSHEFLMEHIWTKESRVREGQMPLLPEVSMAVLDEGHLLEFAAQKALTYEIQSETLIRLLEKVMVDGVREKTLNLMEVLQELHDKLFGLLRIGSNMEETDRMKVDKSPELMRLCKQAIGVADSLLEEFVFESELYTIPEYELRMVEEFLEQYTFSLRLFTEKGDGIEWLEIIDGFETLIIMPRLVTDILHEKLFTSKIPIVFSSATLSIEKDFTYIADSLGIEKFQSFSVASPFDYDEVMKIYTNEMEQQEKPDYVESLLNNSMQTLILFKSKAAMASFRATIGDRKDIVFEGDRELSTIVKEFQNGEYSTLCSYHLWEGLDLPLEALTRVVIYDLPFPPVDPLFDAKRSFSNNPFEEVELPFMLLRLQQGIGRLIRTSSDYGEIHLLLNETEAKLENRFTGILPTTIS
ncbi:ATP-dependent DNA helicase [Psychrobacillus psychrodurans]|uniref:ATP-dependent DNA helicase n=1 Tax=Psychrobacillus psychrodurans TaxID=126157 RepID=UPI0008E3FD6D|nr:ATP-dependent DNA helicase [Psychrobacillus psychrodurans]MCZ8540055.1 ATP-dependent DNA helicase [Psychrobacillus psychrodurans]SFM51158.1 ATP-dependent DNA helicase DinG [Psychrobacillus psychrodurans]